MLVSEVFYSLQGEGLRVGHPSVFVRFFGCNFRCPGFGLPEGQKSTEPDDIAKGIDKYKSYNDLPLAKTGCDSYPSWHPKFKRFSTDMTIEELHDKIISVIPDEVDTKNIDIVFTGGEPMLKPTQSFVIEYHNKYNLNIFSTVTFETNGTQEPLDGLRCIDNLIFSISVKLKCSGVDRSKAINHESLCKLTSLSSNSYFKFVVSSERDVDEIDDIVKSYSTPVYVMPVGGTVDGYSPNVKTVSDIALKKGYIFTPRLHINLFGNSWAT